ncbi:hypothetical protein ACUJ42_05185 [Streptococcus anginosus]|uniref:hypothetical protein n=1 Tax=Streptococcus anginosus TaxID=1328 RepID=UPI000391ACE3|nr:hypothetical protein [Streptococcus anginosus]QBX21751.1 hypothetical protein Javan59_0022 [Streptococcus phage Javan59]GAD41472.1 hypothetical protein ANG4_0066 [Streptococcus anginosus 1505]
MLKLQVKKAFYDWQDNILRQADEVIEMTQVRYDEFTQNLAKQGVDVDDIVAIVKEPKNKEAPAK